MNHLYPALRLKSCEDDGTFSGYASVFDNRDYQQEVVAKGAFSKSLCDWQSQNKMPKMLWQYFYSVAHYPCFVRKGAFTCN